MKNKQGIIERMFRSLIGYLAKMGLFVLGVLLIFTLVLGSEYSFSLRRSAIVYKQQKSVFQKYMKGVSALQYLVKLF